MKKLADLIEMTVLVVAGCVAMFVIVAVAIGAAMMIAGVAKAEGSDGRDNRWHTQRFCARYDWDNACLRYRYQRRQLHPGHYARGPSYREPEGIRYYAAPRYDREDGDDDRRHCKEVRKAVGDQHLSIDGAKKAANDAWAGAVRFHWGERFMDLANAKDVTYLCSRSSIKEAGASVTTLGQALNRCELTALACSPIREREER